MEQSDPTRHHLHQLAFPGRFPGTWSEPKVLRLTNRSEVPLSIESAEIAGPHMSDFAICAEDFSGVNLYPGSWCSVSVRFRPSGAGWRSAELLLSSGETKRRWRVPLVGYGASLEMIADCPEPVAKLVDTATVKVEAVGRCGEPIVVWGEAQMLPGLNCGREYCQSLQIAVPISVLVLARCEEGGNPVKAVFHTAAVQPVRVSVPLSFAASPGGSSTRSRQHLDVKRCGLHVVQRLKVELPVTFDARVMCGKARTGLPDR